MPGVRMNGHRVRYEAYEMMNKKITLYESTLNSMAPFTVLCSRKCL